MNNKMFPCEMVAPFSKPIPASLQVYRNHLAQTAPRASVSLLLPTRGRLLLVQRFLKSVCNTASDPGRIEVILYVDDDDPASHTLDSEQLSVIRITGPSAGMGFYNTCCMQQASSDLFVLVNDDIVISSPAWDTRLLSAAKAFPDGIFLAYANDGFKGEKLSTFPIISRRCSEVLADPYPNAYSGAFIDLHLFDIFKRLQYLGENRLCYLPDIAFEHWHYRTGKSELDDTYRRRNRFEADGTYLRLTNFRKIAAQRLRAAIHGEEMPEYPAYELTANSPIGLMGLITLIVKNTVRDEGIPPWVRLKRSLWFWARLIAARVLPGA